MRKLIASLLCSTLLLGCAACASPDAIDSIDPRTVEIRQAPTALIIGEHNISSIELTYFYVDAINNWYSTYGAYASYFGLSTSLGLDDQFYDQEAGETWGDYFLDLAINNAKNTYALYDEAKAKGYSLSSDERSAVDSVYSDLEAQAKEQDISVNKFLQNIYGKSADEKSYKSYYEATVIASAYYSHYATELKDSYTPEQLRDFEGDTPYNYNSYTYASFYLNLDNFKLGGTKGSDGKVTYSEEELKAAEEYLLKVKDELSAEGIDSLEKLNEAIAKMEAQLEFDKATNPATEDTTEGTTEDTTEDTTEGTTEDSRPDGNTENAITEDKTEVDRDESDEDERNRTKSDKYEDDRDEDKEYSTATENKKVLYEKVSTLMQEWLRDDARKAGDITALAYESTTTDDDGKETKTLKGYYIVLFQECHDNTHALANVRHLLVKFEGGTTNSSTGSTTYSAEEKKKAKDEAEKLLNEWKDGDATEDSFAALSNKHSDDPGSNTNGGLYEDVYPGQMVTAFNDWCFDDARKTGDTGIVETEYGYHIMYYVSDSDENYRDYMVTEDKLEKDLTKWQEALIAGIKLEEKDLTRVNKDLVLNSSSTDSHEGHNH